jgi:hypothetical protein
MTLMEGMTMDMILKVFGAFLLAEVTVTLLLTVFNRAWLKELKEITAEWVSFMQKGIPIPSDHLKIEHPLQGQPTLIPLNFRYRKPVRTFKD